MKPAPITQEQLSAWSNGYNGSTALQLATLALSKTDINDVTYVSKAAFAMRQKFSIDIPTLDVTNQQASGRCWLFAAANVLRERIAKQLNLEAFELSQSYLAFWDKFERVNYFLESIIATADRPADDRTVAFILETGVHDGGQWDMFANIVEKYGVVPKDVYDETFQSSHTRGMSHILNRNLKICAVKLRGMVKAGAGEAELQAAKNDMLGSIYGFLCACYTEPPKTFDFEYVDKDKAYHVEKGLTPKSFCEKYVGDLLAKTVSVIHAPTADKPYHKTFTIEYLGNVAGGKPVKHLNLTMDEFKAAIIRQLEAGKVVWFGSDVGKFGEREKGVWDDQ
ncbi:MAG: aminopeptidase, partial [Clostridia bacterium]|nr:aminopeptidase [Clostridia bacterium]